MSLANPAIAEIAIGAEASLPIVAIRKPPRRTTIAKADVVLNPEPR